jgi:hypothetical protein
MHAMIGMIFGRRRILLGQRPSAAMMSDKNSVSVLGSRLRSELFEHTK